MSLRGKSINYKQLANPFLVEKYKKVGGCVLINDMKNEFNEEEKRLIHEYSYSTPPRRIGFYLMVVLTPLVAEIYGILEKDIPAMIMGFLGLFILVIWVLTSSWSDAKLLTSICKKILTK